MIAFILLSIFFLPCCSTVEYPASVGDKETIIAIYHAGDEGEHVWSGIANKLAIDLTRLFPDKKIETERVSSWHKLPSKKAEKEISILIASALILLPEDVEDYNNRTIIILNTEQPESRFVKCGYFSQWCNIAHQIWDYSTISADQWKGRRKFIPFSTPPVINKKDRNLQEEPHVLFVGAHCQRRQDLQDAIIAAGISNKFYFHYQLWGQDLENAIDEAAVVINWHFYSNPVLEAERITNLAARSKCIISERSNDIGLDSFFEDSIIFVEQGDIESAVKSIQRLLADDAERALYEKKSFDLACKIAKNRDDALLKALNF